MSDNDLELINHDVQEDENLPNLDGSKEEIEPSGDDIGDIDRNRIFFLY